MNRRELHYLSLLLALMPFVARAGEAPRIEPLASPVSVRLRGLSAVSDDIAWASGQAGTVLRSTDGGQSWSVMHVPGAESLDFRDIQGFSARSAVVMAAGPGDASRLFRTSDGGATWTQVLRNPDPSGFFDCMDFDGDRGVLLGDPVAGRFRIIRTRDGGRTWLAGIGPEAVGGEAAFAASGTCVLLAGGGTLVATGGSRARVHYLPERFESNGDWHAIDADLPSPGPSAGLFSLARRDFAVISVGGDFLKPADAAIFAGMVATSTIDGIAAATTPSHFSRSGNEERLVPGLGSRRWDNVGFRQWAGFTGSPGGYRSGLACERGRDPICIATGPDGTDVLSAAGMVESQHWWIRAALAKPPCCDTPLAAIPQAGTWQRLAAQGYDSVANAGLVFWFSGDGGRLGRLVLPATASVGARAVDAVTRTPPAR